MGQQAIDSLLERYLTLLDEYTHLRTNLSTLQSTIFQNIALANFSAERGLRYGQDQYDDRMQASRLLTIEVKDLPSFAIAAVAEREDAEAEKSIKKGATSKTKDPLRWFGVLTPMPLRNAQTLSVEVVEQVIPRLVTVNAKMLNLEIEIQRARKKRTKAAEKKAKAELEEVETGPMKAHVNEELVETL